MDEFLKLASQLASCISASEEALLAATRALDAALLRTDWALSESPPAPNTSGTLVCVWRAGCFAHTRAAARVAGWIVRPPFGEGGGARVTASVGENSG
jgi:hypothetical protein